MQLVVLVVIVVILFGNIPKLFKDVGTGIATFKRTITTKDPLKGSAKKEIEQDHISAAVKKEVESSPKELPSVKKSA